MVVRDVLLTLAGHQFFNGRHAFAPNGCAICPNDSANGHSAAMRSRESSGLPLPWTLQSLSTDAHSVRCLGGTWNLKRFGFAQKRGGCQPFQQNWPRTEPPGNLRSARRISRAGGVNIHRDSSNSSKSVGGLVGWQICTQCRCRKN
jgi:hypothetical protein